LVRSAGEPAKNKEEEEGKYLGTKRVTGRAPTMETFSKETWGNSGQRPKKLRKDGEIGRGKDGTAAA